MGSVFPEILLYFAASGLVINFFFSLFSIFHSESHQHVVYCTWVHGCAKMSIMAFQVSRNETAYSALQSGTRIETETPSPNLPDHQIETARHTFARYLRRPPSTPISAQSSVLARLTLDQELISFSQAYTKFFVGERKGESRTCVILGSRAASIHSRPISTSRIALVFWKVLSRDRF